MKSESLTSSRLAELLEIQPSGISHIVSGRNKPGFDLLQKILRRFPRINPDWLLLDSPTMYRDGSSENSSRDGLNENLSAIDLFEFGAPSSGGSTPNEANNFGANNMGSLMGFSEQNSGRNLSQNGGQNIAQNMAQNSPNFSQNSQRVERVIILYSDGTFRSYNMR